MTHLENIVTELIFIFFHFLLFLMNYYLMNKKIMQPSVLFSLLWFVILSLHFIFRFTLLDELYPLHFETFIIIFVGTLSFSFGSLVINVIKQKKESREFTKSSEPVKSMQTINLTLRYILLILIIIGLPFYIQAAYRLFIASNIEDFFVGLRTELTYGNEDIGPLKYLVSFSFVVYAINLYAYLKDKNTINRILLIACLLSTIAYAVFSTGRTFFFMILIIYFGMDYLHNKKFSIRRYSWYILIFIILFSFGGIIYGKGGDVNSTVKENIYPAAQTTAIYLGTSLNALDYKLNHNLEINNNGDNSLRFFIKLGITLNLISNVKENPILQEFVFIPYATNVYTFYSPYIEDFGKFYAWLMIGIFGILQTILYNKAIITKNIRYSLYFSFLLFPLVLSFFQDQYISLFSAWLQIVFYTEILILMNKFFISKKW